MRVTRILCSLIFGLIFLLNSREISGLSWTEIGPCELFHSLDIVVFINKVTQTLPCLVALVSICILAASSVTGRKVLVVETNNILTTSVFHLFRCRTPFWCWSALHAAPVRDEATGYGEGGSRAALLGMNEVFSHADLPPSCILSSLPSTGSCTSPPLIHA